MQEKFKNIIFVGTSHIAAQSIKQVEKTIIDEQPEHIALELDAARAKALLESQKKRLNWKYLQKIGVKGFLFNLFGAWSEKKLAKIVNTTPGAEMKKALMLAREKKIPVALIDRPIHQTLQCISRSLTWGERWRFVVDLIKSPWEAKKLNLDLNKVPPAKLIAEITEQMEERYPNVHDCLITVRDRHMAKGLYKIATKVYPKKVVVVLGAGHIPGILQHLKHEEWN